MSSVIEQIFRDFKRYSTSYSTPPVNLFIPEAENSGASFAGMGWPKEYPNHSFLKFKFIDFISGAEFTTFYIPEIDNKELLCNRIIGNLGYTFNLGGGVTLKDIFLTDRIYLYVEGFLQKEFKETLENMAGSQGGKLEVRDQHYVNEISKAEKPIAFISHDSRDKLEIAKPLFMSLQQLGCNIWYDEFSLKPGDSLRESIERGLKEAQKCILLLSKSFIENRSWAKREFESIYTKELIEDKKVFLPIWVNVNPEDVYQYCPILADRVAVNWQGECQPVAKQIFRVLVDYL